MFASCGLGAGLPEVEQRRVYMLWGGYVQGAYRGSKGNPFASRFPTAVFSRSQMSLTFPKFKCAIALSIFESPCSLYQLGRKPVADSAGAGDAGAMDAEGAEPTAMGESISGKRG